jgi:hypothetical protein
MEYRLVLEGECMPDLRDHLNVSLFQTGVTPGTDFKFTKNADGTAAVEGFKVFRSGTFRDSLGIQHTWTDEHLTQMVANHEMLKARNLLPNVPVRADHSFSVDKLVGWIDGLYTDETFLRANFRFTEPEAAAKFDRGTYLNRSAEVGLYETNDEAFFWPVLMGFAFVDLPAVEGLFAASQRKYTVITDKETPVPEAPPPPPGSNPPPPPAPAGLHFRAAVGGPEQPVVFSINGQQTSDFMAVQNHIAVLEKFQADAVEAGFVKGGATRTPFGKNQYLRSARGVKFESYTSPPPPSRPHHRRQRQPEDPPAGDRHGQDHVRRRTRARSVRSRLAATDGRQTLANIVGLNDTFLPWQPSSATSRSPSPVRVRRRPGLVHRARRHQRRDRPHQRHAAMPCVAVLLARASTSLFK